MHAEVLPWTIGLLSLLSITPTKFLIERQYNTAVKNEDFSDAKQVSKTTTEMAKIYLTARCFVLEPPNKIKIVQFRSKMEEKDVSAQLHTWRSDRDSIHGD